MILMKTLFLYPSTLSFIYINKANPKILKKVESKSQVFRVTFKPTNYLIFAFCTCLNFGR